MLRVRVTIVVMGPHQYVPFFVGDVQVDANNLKRFNVAMKT
jgi:hypothetical protein